MSKKIYTTDYWNQKTIIIAKSDREKGLIAIGEKIDNGERYIHINIKNLVESLMALNLDNVNISLGGKNENKNL